LREFDYVRPADVREAVAAVSAYPASAYLAGGTTQVDLMLKDGILDVVRLVDIAAAIANALYHATGKRIRSLPITIDQLL
jgi:CO/xanthine dehydrogenase FAD-binding subunit